MRRETDQMLEHDDPDEHTDLEREAALMLEDARDETADTLDDAADTVVRGSRNMMHSVARAAGRTASALETGADYLRDHDSKDMLHDVNSLARRYPGASLAAAAVVGFFLGRAMTRQRV